MPTTSSVDQGFHKQSVQANKQVYEQSAKCNSNNHLNFSVTSAGDLRQPQFSIPSQSFNMFLVKSIEKIAGERETRKSQNGAVKKACEEALIVLKEHLQLSETKTNDVGSHLPPPRSESGILLADEVLLRPFQLACTMKSPKIVNIAIDSLQKLIAYGHIPNSAVCFGGKIRIIDQIVTTICSCFQGPNTDDGIQLQIMKALLTVIASSVVEVHEADILLIVRTCYNIFMAAKNPINQATARATLTQIISIIFQGMEQNALEAAVVLNSSGGSADCKKHYSSCETSGLNETNGHKEEVLNITVLPKSCQLSSDRPIHMTDSLQQTSEVDEVQIVLDDLINQVVKTANGTNISLLETPTGTDSLSDHNSITTSDCKNTTSPNQVSASNFNSTDWSVANNGESDTMNESDSNQSVTSEVTTTAHITQKDAFLVFRSLCRLAVKDSTGPSSIDPKSHTVRSKTISLQLLLNILQQAGPVFSTSEIFIAAIKQYLCVALFKNGTSPVVEVFGLSIALFLALLQHFKPYLKRQTEMFFKDVLLFTLESSKSSFEQKLLVFHALKQICGDAQCMVDIYLNFDCDLNMTNIFEKVTTNLAKIAQGRNFIDQSSNNASTQKILRCCGLECLVLILRCMTGWSQELYHNSESQSFLGSEPDLTIGSTENQVITEQDIADTPVPATIKADDDPQDFESRKAQKEIYELGIALFNQNYMERGLRMLQDNGLLNESVESVTKFLLTEERLSKVHVGSFLGENNPSNLAVMHAYVDQFDFTDKEFVASMREFLSAFHLPGESQKIDRLMEKFAARYYVCNPGNSLFTSADAVYVLAFSIIMLTTDLHSTKIKPINRMTKDDYIRMNRGINDTQDLPADYLGQIYDEIASSGLKLKSDDGDYKLTNVDVNIGTSHPFGDCDNPGESVISNTSDFTFATQREHIKPMLKLTWTPFLAAFSVGLQDCDDSYVTYLCLEGITHVVRIACTFDMEMERNAYVQALARFTLLLTASHGVTNPPSLPIGGHNSVNINNTNSTNSDLPSGQFNWSNRRSLSSSTSSLGAMPNTGFNMQNNLTASESMKQKNIDTIRVLISIAQTDGNYLGQAWLDILRCLSQLESAHLINQLGTSTHHRHHQSPMSHGGQFTLTSPNNSLPVPNSSTSNISNRHVNSSSQQTHSLSLLHSVTNSPEPVTAGSLAAAMVDSKKAAVIQGVMCETGAQSVLVAVDKVFSGSVRLNGDAIVDFVKALCQVSREELNLPQPRTFSLQKLVEISYYNMGRIRLQWSRIWEHIGIHFTTAGRSPDEYVAEFSIDSLRQLSLKLIEKGELPNFHFQKEFLRPFVSILEEPNVRTKIQDMIVRCMYQLVHSQHANIRSGWSNIFAVFHLTASCMDEGIVKMAFETCHFTINDVFPNHLNVVVDAFQPLVKALAEFACNPHFPDTAMESIRLIRTCASTVAEHGFIFVSSQNVEQLSNLPADASVSNGTNLLDEDQIWLKGWMPVLCELFRVINSCKLDVRTRALTIFFDILKTHGGQFKPLWWRETFAVIFRVFQHLPNSPLVNEFSDINQDGDLDMSSCSFANSERTEWLNTTCNHTLFSIVDIFTQFYDPLHTILLDDVYQQLQWCCLQEHEQLARSGTSCLETLILSNGKRFNEQIWESTVQLIVNLFKATVPHQLLTWRPEQMIPDTHTLPDSHDEHSNESPKSVSAYVARGRLFADLLNKCVVQYELIQTVSHILFYSSHSRNEDNYFLHKARELAAASYPAFATALKAINSTSSTAHRSDSHPNSINFRQGSTDLDGHYVPNSCQVNVNKWKWIYNCPNTGTDNSPKQLSAASPLNDNPGGMYAYMSPQQCIAMVHCLLESHKFAKTFNSHDEQRDILFQAGFKVKAKPNLLKQETHSLLCALRVLFRLAEEPSEVREQADELLDIVVSEALSYYHGLIIDGHRHAWDTCLILIITNLINLSPVERFHAHALHLYPSLCDLVAMAGGISPQVAALVRLFLLRCGEFFRPLSAPTGDTSSVIKNHSSDVTV